MAGYRGNYNHEPNVVLCLDDSHENSKIPVTIRVDIFSNKTVGGMKITPWEGPGPDANINMITWNQDINIW